MTPEAVVEEVKASGLRGRGGAGFPDRAQMELHASQRARAEVSGLQLRRVASPAPATTVKFCATTRTRWSKAWRSRPTRWAPRSATTTFAASSSTNPCRGFEAAVKEAYDAGLLGKNIQGSGIDFDLHTPSSVPARTSAARRRRCSSRSKASRASRAFKPPFPANFGLYGKPTTINNTQSWQACRPSCATAPVVRRARSGELGRYGPVFGHRGTSRNPATTSCRWEFRSRICWRSPGACSAGASSRPSSRAGRRYRCCQATRS